MSGWNIFSGLLNFAILAGVLFFIGKKLVPKMLGGRQDQIKGDLERSAAASENAGKLLDGINDANAAGERERAEILDAARTAAEAGDRSAVETDRRSAAHIAGETEKETQLLRRAARSEMNHTAAAEIVTAAAELIARPEYTALP